MAKSSSNSGKQKQDIVISQFRKDIRQHETRTWLNITEQCIAEGAKRREYEQKQKEKNQVVISFHNPDSPLRGSSSWSKQQWEDYKSRQREAKRLARKEAK
jgi:hypothetical protein